MAKKKKNTNLPKRSVGRPRKIKDATIDKKVKKVNVSVKKKKSSKKEIEKIKKGSGFASNNFNRIRSIIWKEYGLDFKNYFDPDFISRVKDVYRECKSRNSDCSETEILIIYDEVSENPQRQFPAIRESLYSDEGQLPYYELISEDFVKYPSYLWIISPMILPQPSEFVTSSYYDNSGSTDKGYRKYFKEFIDWCNHATKESVGNSNIDSSDIEIFVKFTKPQYDTLKQRWWTELFICNSQGARFSFGFEPIGRMKDHDITEEYIEPTLLTVEQIEKRKVATKDLNSSLENLISKYEKIEEDKLKPKAKKVATKKQKVKVVKLAPKIDKDKELKTLTKIKKELTSAIKLYKEIDDKKRMNKALKDLDALMIKIKKLSK